MKAMKIEAGPEFAGDVRPRVVCDAYRLVRAASLGFAICSLALAVAALLMAR